MTERVGIEPTTSHLHHGERSNAIAELPFDQLQFIEKYF